MSASGARITVAAANDVAFFARMLDPKFAAVAIWIRTDAEPGLVGRTVDDHRAVIVHVALPLLHSVELSVVVARLSPLKLSQSGFVVL